MHKPGPIEIGIGIEIVEHQTVHVGANHQISFLLILFTLPLVITLLVSTQFGMDMRVVGKNALAIRFEGASATLQRMRQG